MPIVRASVLVLGHKAPEQVTFGADFASSISEAREKLTNSSYSVLLFSDAVDSHKNIKEFLAQHSLLQPALQKIVVGETSSAQELENFSNESGVFKILRSFEPTSLDNAVQEALEENAAIRQNTQLFELINEQNTKLTQLSQELESRIQRRQKYLESSRVKLESTNKKLLALHETLLALQNAVSVGEIESLINKSLRDLLNLEWTRIHFQHMSQSEEAPQAKQSEYAIFATPLLEKFDFVGHIYFARAKGQPFTEDDGDFLLQVAEMVSLAIERLGRLEEAESIKEQWEATFNSLQSPVALIKENYELLQANETFIRSAKNPKGTTGAPCYKVQFGRETPCLNCRLGQKFQVSQGSRVYQVLSTQVRKTPASRRIFVNIYQDITDQQRLERKVLESSTRAELGLIGGSIAHEINNPLTGIITFLQLIRRELKGDEPYSADIKEMESGALRCKDIVENLLGFSRLNENEVKGPVSLNAIIERASKIVELLTRSYGIRIQTKSEAGQDRVLGLTNPLTQVFVNLLLEAIERVFQRLRQTGVGFVPFIEVKIVPLDQKVSVQIIDNGEAEITSRESSNTSAISVATQILNEHEANITFTRPKIGNNISEIQFNSPVLG